MKFGVGEQELHKTFLLRTQTFKSTPCVSVSIKKPQTVPENGRFQRIYCQSPGRGAQLGPVHLSSGSGTQWLPGASSLLHVIELDRSDCIVL